MLRKCLNTNILADVSAVGCLWKKWLLFEYGEDDDDGEAAASGYSAAAIHAYVCVHAYNHVDYGDMNHQSIAG